MASISEARSNFNLKVLRRHDPSIVGIIESASFVVLYNYNSGEWTKTGVEGPLFLFRRRLPPYNGFFLMNRNGLENFSADVTPEDDLDITPEFIIYRPETTNEVYGIWVFEPNQRMSVGDKLLKLQQMTEGPSEEVVKKAMPGDKETVAAGASGDGKGQATEKEKQQQDGAKGGKGKANGKPKKGAKASAVEKSSDSSTSAAAPAVESAGENETATQISLDDLFGSAIAPAQPEAEATDVAQNEATSKSTAEEQPASNETSLLDSLFQSASLDSDPALAAAATESTKSASSPPKSTDNNHAQNLLSLLGVNTASDAHGSDEASRQTQASSKEPPTEKKEEKEDAGAPKMSDLIEAGIRDRIGLGDDGQPLSRREFVTELLSMVHTNPDFVSKLYGAYVARVS
ncbi:related to decapping enzyme [Ustilago sp. UG-2017b]|nr:related to decapping enzyme [Ustilago sp. UG-2017b]